MKKIFLLFAVSLVFINCKTSEKKEKITGLVRQKAMVVSAREEASKIGADVLKKGGNAFDAMVATELALAVAYPYAGNIGGGGFMVYRKSDGEIGALDYREKAPLAASKDMYLDADRNVIEGKSTLGSMAVGIPGTVAGVFEAHRKFGSLPMENILQPVIALAKRGVIVTKKQAKRIKSYQARFLSANKDTILLNKNWKENDTIKYNA
jgi:gamma-glutamyltranspeptidase/glutathione hydrolase